MSGTQSNQIKYKAMLALARYVRRDANYDYSRIMRVIVAIGPPYVTRRIMRGRSAPIASKIGFLLPVTQVNIQKPIRKNSWLRFPFRKEAVVAGIYYIPVYYPNRTEERIEWWVTDVVGFYQCGFQPNQVPGLWLKNGLFARWRSCRK
jgi:hypothetical protein